MENTTKQQRERPRQLGFEIDEGLEADLQFCIERVPGLKKSDLGRSALREKVREIKQKLENGEEVFVTV